MIIRCATGRFAPAQFAALRAFARARLAPTLGALAGCRSYVAGLDEPSGQFLAVSVWDTEAQAQAADAAAGRLRAEFAAAHEAGEAPQPALADGPPPRYYELIARA